MFRFYCNYENKLVLELCHKYCLTLILFIEKVKNNTSLRSRPPPRWIPSTAPGPRPRPRRRSCRRRRDQLWRREKLPGPRRQLLQPRPGGRKGWSRVRWERTAERGWPRDLQHEDHHHCGCGLEEEEEVTGNGEFPVVILDAGNVGCSSTGGYHDEEEGRGEEAVEDQHQEHHHVVGLEVLHILVQSLGESSGWGRDLEQHKVSHSWRKRSQDTTVDQKHLDWGRSDSPESWLCWRILRRVWCWLSSSRTTPWPLAGRGWWGPADSFLSRERTCCLLTGSPGCCLFLLRVRTPPWCPPLTSLVSIYRRRELTEREGKMLQTEFLYLYVVSVLLSAGPPNTEHLYRPS